MSEEKEKKIYFKLRKHLDQFPIGLPKTDSGVEIKLLKHIFTPEEAKIASTLSIFPKKAHTLFLRFRRKYSEDEFNDILENMAKKGGIFRYRKGDKRYYSNAFLAVGMFEYQLNRMDKEFADNFDQYLDEVFFDEFTGVDTPQLRVIPIEQTVEPKTAIATYDYLEDLVMGERGKISISECICRKKKDLQGEHCEHSRETCFQLGGAADFYIENGLAREIEKEEALEIIRNAEKEGLVIEPGNTVHPYAICCCCGCCCEVLTNLKKLNNPADFVHSNYHAEINQEECIGCGVCLDRCQMNAISLIDEGSDTDTKQSKKVAHLNLERCIGCGLCATTCGPEAIHMVKKSDKEIKIPPKNTKELYMKIGMEKSEMKNK